MRRALVVDDDAAVAAVVSRALEHDGYIVDQAASGAGATTVTSRRTYELIILDVNIPPPDELALCRLLRSRGDDAMIVVLIMRGRVDDRVAGLDAGADDYLPKPFELRELLARVRALQRRHRGPDPRVGPLAIGGIELDPSRRLVTCHETLVQLTPASSTCSRRSCSRRQRAVTQPTPRRSLGNGHGERVVDVYVGYLRA